MKRLLFAVSLAIACIAPSVAFAHDDDDHRHRGHYDRHYDHDDDDDRGHYRGEKHKRKHKGWKREHYRRGERIEVVYVEPRYYVDDYHHYRLRQPPRGHRWIRTDDGKFILVAVATGIIADILLHH